ncbi:uncharacterized protein LOC104441548 [Eucalyptus grandis]|uniref:uncharacterized protein LOC104441548 n=1 Tax=Eucalyptus grandis TaxID=71139 RepID=UPI00192EBA16|nr:uncharacterized protein LOC104441548 [Eucalyptus grandis]
MSRDGPDLFKSSGREVRRAERFAGASSQTQITCDDVFGCSWPKTDSEGCPGRMKSKLDSTGRNSSSFHIRIALDLKGLSTGSLPPPDIGDLNAKLELLDGTLLSIVPFMYLSVVSNTKPRHDSLLLISPHQAPLVITIKLSTVMRLEGRLQI